MKDPKRVCDESCPKRILINTVRFVGEAYLSLNKVILVFSILCYVEKYGMKHKHEKHDLLVPPSKDTTANMLACLITRVSQCIFYIIMNPAFPFNTIVK